MFLVDTGHVAHPSIDSSKGSHDVGGAAVGISRELLRGVAGAAS